MILVLTFCMGTSQNLDLNVMRVLSKPVQRPWRVNVRLLLVLFQLIDAPHLMLKGLLQPLSVSTLNINTNDLLTQMTCLESQMQLKQKYVGTILCWIQTVFHTLYFFKFGPLCVAPERHTAAYFLSSFPPPFLNLFPAFFPDVCSGLQHNVRRTGISSVQ